MGHGQDPLMAMRGIRNHLDLMAVLNLLTMLQNDVPTLAWVAGASVRTSAWLDPGLWNK